MKKESFKNGIIIFLILFLIFQSPLSKLTSGEVSKIIDSFDEIIALLMFATVLFRLKINKIQAKFLILQLLLITVGLTGSIINNYEPLNIVLMDIVSCSKFVAVLLGITSLYKNNDDFLLLMKQLIKIVKILISIFLGVFIIDLLFKLPFVFHNNIRFGMSSLQLFYYHPSLLGHILVAFLAILSFDDSTNDRKKAKYKIICLVMLCFTFRTKAIGFAIMYIFIWNYKYIIKKRLLCSVLLLVSVFLVIYISKNSISTYYGSAENSARAKLTAGSIEIAKENFPIGAGFGTYGTAAAVKNYSVLYNDLGFYKVYGLGLGNTNYATDTFWPAIIGQFGFLGLAIYIVLIYFLIKNIKLLAKIKSPFSLLYSTILVYMLICSTSSTSFFNPISVLYAILLGLGIASIKEIKNE